MSADKQAIARGDGAALTCSASIQYPPFSMLSFIKNGQTVATSQRRVLQIDTKTIHVTPFGLHICQLNASGVTLQKSVFLKEQGMHSATFVSTVN